MAIMKYIGSHFLTIHNTTTGQSDSRGHRRRISAESTQSPGRNDAAKSALETEAFACLSRPEEDGYQVQCMLLLSITTHAHGNFVDAIRMIKSATSLALKLGMNRHCFSVTHGYGSPLLEEMWRRCYWELFVVESLLCALMEESAGLYGVASDVPLPCDEGMLDLHLYRVSTIISQATGYTNDKRLQDDTQSKMSSITARAEPNSSTRYLHSPIESLPLTSWAQYSLLAAKKQHTNSKYSTPN